MGCHPSLCHSRVMFLGLWGEENNTWVFGIYSQAIFVRGGCISLSRVEMRLLNTLNNSLIARSSGGGTKGECVEIIFLTFIWV